jgi:hypothetical protein
MPNKYLLSLFSVALVLSSCLVGNGEVVDPIEEKEVGREIDRMNILMSQLDADSIIQNYKEQNPIGPVGPTGAITPTGPVSPTGPIGPTGVVSPTGTPVSSAVVPPISSSFEVVSSSSIYIPPGASSQTIPVSSSNPYLVSSSSNGYFVSSSNTLPPVSSAVVAPQTISLQGGQTVPYAAGTYNITLSGNCSSQWASGIFQCEGAPAGSSVSFTAGSQTFSSVYEQQVRDLGNSFTVQITAGSCKFNCW